MKTVYQQNLTQGRILSVDALRGFDIFWIIGGAAIFASLHRIFDNSTTEFIKVQLTHVEWEGFRFEDLIMPLFLFIVGVVMPFAFDKRLARGDSKAKLYVHIIKRTVILFVLGMIAQGHLLEYDLSKLSIFSNTLQAIAVGYLIASIVILHLHIRWQVVVAGLLLLVFWALMMLVPVPKYGAGVLTAEGNLAIYIDRIMGNFQDGTSYTWILSGLTFGATTLSGCFAGAWLKSDCSEYKKAAGLVVAGLISLAAGWFWGIWFPVIKHLWTSSFVLFSSGICLLLLAVFYLVIDVWGLRKWAFGFIVIGSNAIAVYMVTRLFSFEHVGDIFVHGLDRWTGSWTRLIHATAGFAVLWLVMWWMYRKKTFIKV